MTTWAEVARAEPEFAGRVRQLFDVRKHKTIATLRRDGSPRISGIEVSFDAGSVWVGMMPGSVKALDVARDPRVALHSPTVDPPDDDPGRVARRGEDERARRDDRDRGRHEIRARHRRSRADAHRNAGRPFGGRVVASESGIGASCTALNMHDGR
jgi:hypothetical protein